MNDERRRATGIDHDRNVIEFAHRQRETAPAYSRELVVGAYAERLPSRRSAGSLGRVLVCLAMSFALHGLGAFFYTAFAALGWLSTPRQPPPAELEVETASVSASDWARNHDSTMSAPDASKTKAQKDQAKEALPKGQIVAVEGGNDQKSDDARYLAEHDNHVDKETRAREQTAFYQKAMPMQTTDHANDAKAKTDKLEGNRGTGSDATKPAQSETTAHEIPKTAAQQKVAMTDQREDGETSARANSAANAGNSYRLKLDPGMLAAAERAGSEGKEGTPEAPSAPTSAGRAGAATGAAPNDYLNNVPVGDGTFLNTREFKYATFFNRIKQRVGEQWHPNDVIRRRDPQGSSVAHGRMTGVDVTLDDSGQITDIDVIASSGLDFLDEEAVAAFKRAGPFLNPPKGLLESDGHIHFRFAFHVDNDPQGQLPFHAPRGHW